MAQPRQSLSRLFLNKQTSEEARHQAQLQALAKAAHGKPFVLDDAPLRMMYLTPDCMQSAMRTDMPSHLLCAYSRAMMGFLLFNSQPEHIVLIGLGGGSLVKYCYEHFPQCRITAVEIDADVIALRDAFGIPADNTRLQIIHADAVDWLPQQQCEADVIFLDAYDVNGLVPALNSDYFYAICYQQLSEHGVLVANVWGKPSVIAPMLTRLHHQFQHQVWWSKSADSYNLLVFTSKAAAHSDVDAPRKLLDDALINQHPTLALRALSASLHYSPHQASATAAEISLNESLQAQLRTLLVADSRVPQDYAGFRSLVLNATASA
ncbi:fused MFS/spermidine synthase [Undibacterium sp. RuRC25W]|uniref:fused MFS/spermidine synthase n=1 Tax=Undibacterium sp. RuRC25W TaxID=3413047 RepID=UPI003BF1B4D5